MDLNYKPIFLSSKNVAFHLKWWFLLHLKHSLGFNAYHWHFSFHNGFKQLCSLKIVFILRATLWKLDIKCKIVMFFNILGSFLKMLIFQIAKFYLT